MTVLTPVQLQPDTLFALHSAHPRRYPILFQSIARGEPLGRYDILLACPREWLTLTHDGKLVNNAGLDSADTFLATLDRWWLREQIPAEPVGLPFSGGWFLYLGYELAQEIEPTLKLRSEHIVAQAIRIPAALIVRHSDQTAWIVEESASEHCGRQIAADISALSLPLGHREFPLVRQLAEDPD